ncbi:MAG: hypothetical protein OXH86_11830 [Acidimicrobiaceae bacterium]|nr:hypothetical protein [Acidimicrobiaceae bacterium]
MTAFPDSIVLAFPPGWDDIPTEVNAYRRRLAQQVAQLRANDVKRSDARLVEVQGALIHRLISQQNVVIANSYVALETPGPAAENDDAETSDEAGGADAPVLVMAGAAVSTLMRREMQTEVPLAADVLLSAYGQEIPGDDERVRYAEIEPPSTCRLGDLEAVKLVRLMNVSSRVGDDHKLFSQSYLVPVADGDAVIAMQFSTINFEYAKQFSELFGRIAGTLRVLYPDDPTFLDDATAADAEQAVLEAADPA